jgi:hypothetical protein
MSVLSCWTRYGPTTPQRLSLLRCAQTNTLSRHSNGVTVTPRRREAFSGESSTSSASITASAFSVVTPAAIDACQHHEHVWSEWKAEVNRPRTQISWGKMRSEPSSSPAVPSVTFTFTWWERATFRTRRREDMDHEVMCSFLTLPGSLPFLLAMMAAMVPGGVLPPPSASMFLGQSTARFHTTKMCVV